MRNIIYINNIFTSCKSCTLKSQKSRCWAITRIPGNFSVVRRIEFRLFSANAEVSSNMADNPQNLANVAKGSSFTWWKQWFVYSRILLELFRHCQPHCVNLLWIAATNEFKLFLCVTRGIAYWNVKHWVFSEFIQAQSTRLFGRLLSICIQ